MKKRIKTISLLFLIFIILMFTGCDESKNERKIDAIVSNFFNGSYEYNKTNTCFVDNKDHNSTVTVVEGKVTRNPYKEYVRIVENADSALWTEAYYYGNGKVVNALIKKSEGWQKIKMKAEHPYGYEQKLNFKLDREEKINGSINEVYTTEYKINIGKKYRINEKLECTVKQEYYLDNEKQILTRIDTDLTDLNKKTYIANDISVNGETLDIAKKNMEQQQNLSEIEQLEIFNFNGGFDIDIPEDARILVDK
ncbi:hypothetical protein [Robinsoniella peoriensis]|uniref:hypothetical protein n=1 Tax=Robinsoniella peoriensis TaxID=180332 RepID=UPI0005C7E61F|nr:hypothetical protein [Robinsoniella peoriensis]